VQAKYLSYEVSGIEELMAYGLGRESNDRVCGRKETNYERGELP